MILCPVKKTVWGNVDSVETLKNHIAKAGQPFGVDWSGPACEFNPEYPCDKTFYEYMGWGLHKGIDIGVSTGTEIFSAHDGIVVKTSDSLTAGIGIVIRSLDNQFETLYWHLLNYNYNTGNEIKEGDVIGYSDNTGYSKGPHLHFEYKIWKDNDYIAVDPMPYFVFDNNMKFELMQVADNPEVYLIRNGKKTHIYNANALLLVADFSDIKPVTQAKLDAIPDSGLELASLVKE